MKKILILILAASCVAGGLFVVEKRGGSAESLEGKRVALIYKGPVEVKGINWVENVDGYERALVVEVIDYCKGEESLTITTCITQLDPTDPEARPLTQRTFTWSHPLPKANRLIDYSALSPSDYLHTPLAVAHHRFGKELAQTLTKQFQGLPA